MRGRLAVGVCVATALWCGAGGTRAAETSDGLAPGALAARPAPSQGAPATGLFGNWVYASGKTTRVCPGEKGTDSPPEGALVVAAGASAKEVSVIEPGACTLRFSRAGKVVKIAPGQTCAGPDGAGGKITFSKMRWTLTLSADGKTLTESLSADETLAPANGAARTCKFTESGVTLKRAP